MKENATTPEVLNCLWQELDDRSKALLLYLMEHRYADIGELLDFTGAANHMELLLAIRETINPVAERLLGYPLLTFAESRYDKVTGKKLCFKWWLAENFMQVARIQEGPLRDNVDVLEDRKSILILIDTTGFGLQDLSLEVTPEEVRLTITKANRTWLKKIPLPTRVITPPLHSAFNNGILSINLLKER